MADFDDEIQSEDAPVKLDRSALIGSDAPKLITAAAIGAAVGAAVSHFLQDFRSGDEPPIRVKGGSIKFELLSSTATWKPVGSGRDHWVLSHGQRGRDEYVVVLVIQDAAGKLESHTLCGRKKIKIQYDEQGLVELKSNSKRTQLKSTHKADSDTSNPPELTYLREVKRIIVDSESFDIPSGGKLESMLLLDC
jgi:hypothetical protein